MSAPFSLTSLASLSNTLVPWPALAIREKRGHRDNMPDPDKFGEAAVANQPGQAAAIRISARLA